MFPVLLAFRGGRPTARSCASASRANPAVSNRASVAIRTSSRPTGSTPTPVAVAALYLLLWWILWWGAGALLGVDLVLGPIALSGFVLSLLIAGWRSQRPGLTGAAVTVEAVYETPFQAHACMEPMNCTAHYRHGEAGAPDSLELWIPTQFPGGNISTASTRPGTSRWASICCSSPKLTWSTCGAIRFP